jgi:hypothetical protein
LHPNGPQEPVGRPLARFAGRPHLSDHATGFQRGSYESLGACRRPYPPLASLHPQPRGGFVPSSWMSGNRAAPCRAPPVPSQSGRPLLLQRLQGLGRKKGPGSQAVSGAHAAHEAGGASPLSALARSQPVATRGLRSPPVDGASSPARKRSQASLAGHLHPPVLSALDRLQFKATRGSCPLKQAQTGPWVQWGGKFHGVPLEDTAALIPAPCRGFSDIFENAKLIVGPMPAGKRDPSLLTFA